MCTEENKVGMSAPWVRFCNLLTAFFSGDPSVTIKEAGDEKDGKYVINVSCPKDNVLASIRKLVGTTRVYGNITVEINYNCTSDEISDEEFIDALADTGLLFDVQYGETPLGEFMYPVMKAKVVQFYSDNINDLYGNTNLTAADALREILDPNKDLSKIAISTQSLKEVEEEDDPQIDDEE